MRLDLGTLFNRWRTVEDMVVKVDTYRLDSYVSYCSVGIPAGHEFIGERYRKGDEEVLVFESTDEDSLRYVGKDGKDTGKTFSGMVEIPLEKCEKLFPWRLAVGAFAVAAALAVVSVKRKAKGKK